MRARRCHARKHFGEEKTSPPSNQRPRDRRGFCFRTALAFLNPDKQEKEALLWARCTNRRQILGGPLAASSWEQRGAGRGERLPPTAMPRPPAPAHQELSGVNMAFVSQGAAVLFSGQRPPLPSGLTAPWAEKSERPPRPRARSSGWSGLSLQDCHRQSPAPGWGPWEATGRAQPSRGGRSLSPGACRWDRQRCCARSWGGGDGSSPAQRTRRHMGERGRSAGSHAGAVSAEGKEPQTAKINKEAGDKLHPRPAPRTAAPLPLSATSERASSQLALCT